jgi:hypothetical protein
MSLISWHNIYDVIHHCGYCFNNCDWYKKEKQKLCPKEKMTTCLFVLAHVLRSNKKPNVLGHGMHALQQE